MKSKANGTKTSKRRSVVVEPLEPRVLYSSDIVPASIADAEHTTDIPETSFVLPFLQPEASSASNKEPVLTVRVLHEEHTLNREQHLDKIKDSGETEVGTTQTEADVSAFEDNSSTQQVKEIIFVDAGVPDADILINDLLASRDTSSVVVIKLTADIDESGLEQVSAVLQNYNDLESLHFVTHGTDGSVQLGDMWLTTETLGDHTNEVASWSESLADDADILFYGCDLANTEEGQSFVDLLSALTLADVAASDDATGHKSLGGDWELEYTVGNVETDIAFSMQVQQNWSATLQAVTVTTFNDVVNGDTSSITNLISNDGGDGISLREAIIAANSNSIADTIILSEGTYALTLTGGDATTGDLDILNTVEIVGAANGSTIIDGSALNDRIFHVNTNSLTLRNLTVTGGDTADPAGGGGILVGGGSAAVFDSVVVTGNSATTGGGIRASSSIDVTNSTFSANTATVDGAGIALTGGSSTFDNVTISGNNATADGGGLYVSSSAGGHTFTNITISGNSANNGGGVATDGGPANFNHATVTDNTATNNGGGISRSSGVVNLASSIIADNTATSATEISGTITSSGFNIIGDGPGDSTGGTGYDASDLLNQTGLSLGALADNGGPVQTHELQTGSVGIDETGSPTPDTDGRGYYRVDSNADIGAYESGALSNLEQDLVAHFEFEEGSGLDAVDSALGNTGNIINAGEWTNDSAIGSLALDLSNDSVNNNTHINVPDNPQYDFGTGEFTVSLWYNMALPSETVRLFGNLTSSIGDSGFALRALTTGEFSFERNDGLGSQYGSGAATMDGNWHQLTVVVESDGSVVFYNDGVDTTTSFTASNVNVNTSSSLLIGAIDNIAGDFEGKLDDVRLYSRALNASEASQLAAGESQTTNSPATIDLDANDSSGATGTGYNTIFTVGGLAVPVADSDAVITDPDTFNHSTMTITLVGYNPGEDLLIADTSGTSLTFNFDTITGEATLFDFGSPTLADFEQVLSTISYLNSSSTPEMTDKTIQFHFGGDVAETTVQMATPAVDPAPTNLSSGIELNTDGGDDAYFIASDGGAIVGGLEQLSYEVTFATTETQNITLLSYRSPTDTGANDDAIRIQIHTDGKLNVAINGIGVSYTAFDFNQLRDGEIHSVATTWDNSSGHFAAYVDGVQVLSDTAHATGEIIRTGGTLVIGQEQDSVSGGFTTAAATSATFYDIRVWDEVRTESEIALNHQQKIDPANLPGGLIANWQMDGFDTAHQIVDIVGGNNLGIGHVGQTPINSWTNQVGGVTATGNTLTYVDNGAPEEWGSQINSANVSTLGYTDDYTIRFTLDNTTNYSWIVGLGSTETGTSLTDPEYAIFVDYLGDTNDVDIKHNGVTVGRYDINFEPGGEFGFYVNGTTLAYQYDGVTFATDTIPASTDWYVDTGFYVRTSDSTYNNQDDYSLSNFHIISGNSAAAAGFTESTPVDDLNIDEHTSNGTTVGYVVPTDPDLSNDIIEDGLFTHAGVTSLTNYTTGETIGGAGGSWLVTSGNVDLEGAWAGTPLGGTALGLDGSTPGEITQQNIPTVAGTQYQVVFALTGHFSGPPTADLNVSIDGASENFNITMPDNWSSTNLLWEHRSFNFIADSSTADLTFSSLSPSGSTGPVIGDVQVIEIPPAISTILSSDPALTYDAASGKFYRLVGAAESWTDAQSIAIGDLINGVTGNLATVRSASEGSALQQLMQDNGVSGAWIGASDNTNEGIWTWQDGSGEVFYNGASVPGMYENFGVAEPSGGVTENYAELVAVDGTFNDLGNTDTRSYIIEWDANEILSSYTFDLVDDANGRFAIDTNTGEITVTASQLNHEASDTHNIRIEVTDAAGNTYDELMTIVVNDLNDSPVITGQDLTLGAVAQTDTNPPGITVADMLLSGAADAITDEDVDAVEGIAVVAANNTNGSWQYSLDGGSIWNGMPATSTSSALLLDESAMIRFVPNATFSGSEAMAFFAWDQTDGRSSGDSGIDTFPERTSDSGSMSSTADIATIEVSSGINNAPSFGTEGYGILSQGVGGYNQNADSWVLSNGSVLITPYDTSFNSTIAKLNPDGSLDTGFANAGYFDSVGIGYIGSIVEQPDGKILVGGQAGGDIAVARFNANGTVDTGFGTAGLATYDIGGSDRVFEIALQTDGKIVAAGRGAGDSVILRLNVDGSLDTTFDTDGIRTFALGSSNEAFTDVQIQSDGNIVLVSNTSSAIIRLLTDGSLDSSFDTDGTLNLANNVSAVHIQADGKLVVTGTSGSDLMISRFDTDGSPDTTFGSGGTTTWLGSSLLSATGIDLIQQSDGMFVVAANVDNNGPSWAAIRFDSNGLLDTSFGTSGAWLMPGSDDISEVNSVSLYNDGGTEKIILSGYSTLATFADATIVRLNPDGTLDTSIHSGKVDESPTFVEGGSPVVLDSDVFIFDPDLLGNSVTYDGTSLTLVRNGGTNAEDVFSESGLLGPLTEGSAIIFDGANIGTVTTNNSGTLRLDFSGALSNPDNISGAMSSIAYSNSSDTPPANVQLDWTFDDGNTGAQGAGGALQATASLLVTITPVNDAPVVIAPGSAFNFTEQGSLNIHGAGLFSVADADDNGGTLTATFSVGEGRVLINTGDSGVTVLSGNRFTSGNSTDTVTFSGNKAQLNALLSGSGTGTITYLHNQTTSSDVPSGSTTITLTVNDRGNTGIDPGATADGVSEEGSATQTINITSVNDASEFLGAELITNADFSAGFTDWTTTGQTTVLGNEARFGSGNVAGPHSLSQTVATKAGETYLLEFDHRDDTGSWNQQLQVTVDGGGNLLQTGQILSDVGDTTSVKYRFTFVADSANATLTFTDTSDDPGSQSAESGGVDGYIGNISVRQTSGELNTVSFTEGSTPVSLYNNLEIFDAELTDTDNFSGATLTLQRSGGANVEDIFSATGNLSFVGTTTGNIELTSVGVVGTYSNTGGILTLMFTTSSTINLHEIIQSIQYSNNSDIPPANVPIDWTFDDGNTGAQGAGGALQATASSLVSITSVNDAPLVAANTGASTTIGGTVVITAALLNEADPDDDGAELTYAVTSTAQGQVESLSNPGVPALSFTQADIDAGDIVFVHDGLSGQAGSFDFELSDGGEDGAGVEAGTFFVSIGGATSDSYSTDEDTVLSVNATSGLLTNDGSGGTGNVAGNVVVGFDASQDTGDATEWNSSIGSVDLLAGTGVTLTNNPTNPPTGITTVFDLNGSGGLTSPALDSFAEIDSTQSATLETWIQFDSLSGTQVIFDTGQSVDGGSPSTGGIVLALVNGSLRLTVADNGGSTIATQTAPFTPNTWHHIALTVDMDAAPPSVDVWIDGNQYFSRQLATLTNWGDGAFGLGTNNGSTPGNYSGSVSGEIAHFRIHDEVLSSADITSNFANPGSTGVSTPYVASTNVTGMLGNVVVYTDGSFTYNPNGQFEYLAPGQTATDTFVYTYDDGLGNQDTATVTMTINGVNDAPIIDLDSNNSSGGTGLSYNGSFTENGGPVNITDIDAILTDVDNTNLNSIQVQIVNRLDGNDEQLWANPGVTGLTVNYDFGAGILTISGSATVAEYEQVLRTATYDNWSDNPDTTQRTLNVIASDSASNSLVAQSRINVTSVNDAPVFITIPDASGQTVDSNAPGTTSATTADIDGDGTPDLVTTAASSGEIIWYQGDGAGNFGTGTVVASALVEPMDVVTADLDGDGDMDIVAADYNTTQGNLVILTNDGSGNFSKTTLETVSNGIVQVETGDIDGDGDIDIAANFWFTSETVWYDNIGGNNWVKNVVGTGGGGTSVELADVNNDGEMDIISTYRNTSEVVWYENDGGAASFTAHANTVPGAFDSVAADLDGDGDVDLGYIGLSGALGWLENDGAATPGFTDNQLGTDFGKPARISASDIDGDGDQDLLVAFSASIVSPSPAYDDRFVIFTNDGTGSFAEEIFDNGTNPTSITATDLDNDGDLEILTTDSGTSDVIVHENLGNGEFARAQTFEDLATTLSPIVIDDADAGTAPLQVLVTVTSGTVDFSSTSGLTFTTGNGTDDNLAIFTGSLADINAAFNILQFNPLADFNGEALLQITVDDQGNTGNGGAMIAQETLYIDVLPVNDAPDGTDNTIVTAEDGAHSFGPGTFGLTDIEPDSFQSVIITSIPGSGTLALSGVAVIAGQEITAAEMSGLLYTAAADVNGNGVDSFTFQVRDDGGTDNGGFDTDQTPNTMTISIVAVNDTPTATAPATLTSTEQIALDLDGAGFAVGDIDSGTANIEVVLNVTEGVLSIGMGNSGVSVSNSGSSTATLTGTVGQINNLLSGSTSGSVQYHNTLDNPSASATLTMTVNDLGNSGSDPGLTGDATSEEVSTTTTINITPVNDAPVIDLDADDSTTTGIEYRGTFVEGTGPVNIVDNDSSIIDPDNTTLSALVVTITNLLDGSNESLSVTVPDGSWVQSYNPVNGRLMIAPGSAPHADWETVIESIQYNNTSVSPDLTERVINFTGTDGTDVNSPVAVSRIAITANQAPVLLTTSPFAVNHTENNGQVGIDTLISISDVDSTILTSASVSITTNYTPGQDTLVFTNQPGLSGSFNTAAGVLTITGNASVADYQAALRTITFDNSSESPNTATRQIEWSVTDASNNSSNLLTRDLNVTAVNDAPVLDPTGTMSLTTISENDTNPGGDTIESLITSAGGDRITDVDSVPVEGIALTYVDTANGSWQYKANAGSTWTAVAPVGPSNAVLLATDSLIRFIPNTNYSGTATFSFYAWDQTSGSVGQLVDPNPGGGTTAFSNVAETGTITVLNVNMAPESDTSAGFGVEDTVVAFSISGSDPDGNVDSFRIINIPANGSLYTDAGLTSPVTANTILSTTGTNTLDLWFSPTTDWHGVTSFDFTAIDNEGLEDATAGTRTLSIGSVNDRPDNLVPVARTAVEETATVFTGITISDVDAASGNLTTQLQVTNGTLNVSPSGSATISAGTNGTENVTIQGTVADINATLAALIYTGNTNVAGAAADTLTVTTNDLGNTGSGGPQSAVDVIQINITAVNDAPVLSTIEALPTAYTEGNAPVIVTGNLSPGDVDDTHIESASIAITGNFAGIEDVLSFTDQLGISGIYDSATGILSLTGPATLTDYQTALQTIVYENTSDNPSVQTRTISFTVNDGDLDSNLLSRNINFTATNDAPVLATIEALPASYTEGNAPVIVTGNLSASDVDDTHIESATIAITGGFINGEDVLGFNNQLGISGIYDASTGVLSLNGSATLIDYQTALQTIVYENTSDNPSDQSRTVSFTVNDGDLNSGTLSRDIDFTATNDAPVLSTIEALPVYFTENGQAINVTENISVTDVDSTLLQSATVSISGNFAATEDVLAFTDTPAIAGSYDATTGILTLSGNASLAQYQSALQNVTYQNISDDPSDASRAIEFIVNDGALDSTPLYRNVIISPENDAPVLSAIETTPILFNENSLAVGLTSTIELTDLDDTTIESATIAITSGYSPGDDWLTFIDQSGITGNFDSTNGVLTLSGASSLLNYENALRTIGFANGSDDPSTVNRIIEFTVNDSLAQSNTVTREIVVSASNDAPVITNLEPTDLSFEENAVALQVTSTLSVTDPDDSLLESATVAISDNYVATRDSLVFADQPGITGTFDSLTGTLHLSGVATVADYQNALRSVAFLNAGDDPSTLPRTIDFTVNDGDNSSNIGSRIINVLAVNDNPVLLSIESAPLNFIENQDPLPVTDSLSVVDTDNATLEGATVSLSQNFAPNQDALSFTPTGNITGSFDTTTGSLTLTGTASVNDYQTVLRSVTYHNSSENPSTLPRSIEISVRDLSAESVVVSRIVNVTGVNDAPAGTDKDIELLEDTDYPLTVADFGFSDPLDNHNFSGILIEELPAHGELLLNGDEVVTGQFVSVDDITAGNLIFSPEPDANGISYDNLNFKVIDDGGDQNDSIDVSIFANQIDFDVINVNDPPAGSDSTVTTQEDTVHVFSRADFGYSDVKDGNQFVAITVSTIPDSGSLTLDNNPVTAEQVINIAEIDTGLLRYTPPQDVNGLGYNGFSFNVHDNGGTDNGGDFIDQLANYINFDVPGVNDPPLLITELTSFDEGSENVITTDMLSATDADDLAPDDLTFTINSLPGNGSLTLDGVPVTVGTTLTLTHLLQDRLQYTHDGSETSADTFNIQVSDGGEDGSMPVAGTFNLIINEVIDPAPVIDDESVLLAYGQTFDSEQGDKLDSGDNALAAQVIAENSRLIVSIETQPTSGTVSINSDGTFSYQHNGSSILNDSFQYRVTNEDGIYAIATVKVTIEPPFGNAFDSTNSDSFSISTGSTSMGTDNNNTENGESSHVEEANEIESANTIPFEFEYLYTTDASTDSPEETGLADVETIGNDEIVDTLKQPFRDLLAELDVRKHNTVNYTSISDDDVSTSVTDIEFFIELDSVRLHNVVNNENFVNGLDQLEQNLSEDEESELRRYRLATDITIGASVSVTAGLLTWALRGGALFASVMASSPLWGSADPYRVLNIKANREQDGPDNVEEMFR